MKKFEILAPAGSFSILKAVVQAGADAVYVGGSMFGARAYANNFTEEELLEAIDYVHLRGVKIYLTVNTLLKNEEINKLYDYLLPYYEKGLDAVLVQDFGALTKIHQWFPDLPIHTSTQMTVTGVDGVRFLSKYGVTRVVMAREVSISEMKRIHEETGMELEAFVHGALCYCYSGQCLFSSMIGGRSGNRGRCAQPCRLSYGVLDEKKKEVKKESYVLSLKDFCGIEQLGNLLEAGVYSLKIEGRMKKQSYAAGVVASYRKYVDKVLAKQSAVEVAKADKEELLAYGSRIGVTDGYFKKHNGADMITFEQPSFTQSLEYEDKGERKVKIIGYGSFVLDQQMSLTLTCEDTSITVYGNVVEAAKSAPVTKEAIYERLNKLGDSSFIFAELEVWVDDGIFVPNGALNKLRRDAIYALEEALLAAYRRKATIGAEKVVASEKAGKANIFAKEDKKNWIVSLENYALLPQVLKESWIRDIYLETAGISLEKEGNLLKKAVFEAKNNGKQLFLALPHVFRYQVSGKYEKQVDFLKDLPFAGFLVRNYEEIQWIKDKFPEKKMVLDHNLYTYNDGASHGFFEEGVDEITLPLELNKGEIRKRDNTKTQMVVYGYYPLMISAQCINNSTLGCDQKQKLMYLKDRYKNLFPVRNYCNCYYNIVYNSLPTNLLQQLDEISSYGIHTFRIHLTVETPEEVANILSGVKMVAEGMPFSIMENEKYTKGHYKRGVE